MAFRQVLGCADVCYTVARYMTSSTFHWERQIMSICAKWLVTAGLLVHGYGTGPVDMRLRPL